MTGHAGPDPLRWDLDGLVVGGSTASPTVHERWSESFAPRRIAPHRIAPGRIVGEHGRPDLRVRLEIVGTVPPAPTGLTSCFTEHDLLGYYVDGARVVVQFPRFGQLHIDLDAGTTDAQIVDAALTTYGVFEDLVAVALSPHLRRRDRYLVHAFAAALDGRGVLLVGGIGAGKTTTGLVLLAAGWQLLSNDSPLLASDGGVAAYPGLIAAFPDSLERFDATKGLLERSSVRTETFARGRAKISFAGEAIWPDVWRDRAELAAVIFPTIEARNDHALESIGSAETMTRLIPHTVERWDRPTIPGHLQALRRACESAQGYVLRLGPDVESIAGVLAEALRS